MSRENIPGRDALIWIYDEWLKIPPRQGAIVVEVGVALGKSISYIADRLLEMGRTDVQLYAVDSWAGQARNGEQQQLGADAGGDWSLYCKMMLENDPKAFEFIRPLRVDSISAAEVFGQVTSPTPLADLVVLDADHTYKAVIAELKAWDEALRPGGWIGGDDHSPEYPGVQQACEKFFGKGNYEVSTNNPYQWPVWLKRGGK